ncbi:MAG: hypothetical protein JXM70_11770 [Pirellulales bacterium]|nr:hypothetical protein [Pirellulales bacterium]
MGHAVIARHGIVQSLCELVEQGWLESDDALELVEPLLRGNARRVFRLKEKTRILQNVPWRT